MAKKLTVEVDADVSKAKRKVGALAQAGSGMGGDGGPVSPAADRAARSLDRAAAGAKGLSDAAERGSSHLSAMTKVFGGMAVRMATSYAATQMEPGSTAQTVVKGAGDVASGAMMGAAFGPLGALAGGIAGLTQAVMSAQAETEARKKAVSTAQWEFGKAEKDYASNRAFAEQLKGLSSVDRNAADLAERIAAVDAELAHYREVEQTLVEKTKKMIADGDLETAKYQREYLAGNRSRQRQLEALRDNLVARQDERQPSVRARAGTTGPDALARLGLGGGGEYRETVAVQKEMASTLKAIEVKIGGAAWR